MGAVARNRTRWFRSSDLPVQSPGCPRRSETEIYWKQTNRAAKRHLIKCGGPWLHITAGRRTRVCIYLCLKGTPLAEHPRKDVRRSFRPHGPRFGQCWLKSLLSLAMAAYRAEKGLSTAESKPSRRLVLAWKGRMQTGYIILTNPHTLYEYRAPPIASLCRNKS